MIEMDASQFWSGVLLIVGVQVFSLVFERLMLYRVLADMKRDTSQTMIAVSRIATAMHHLSLGKTQVRVNQGKDTELGDIFASDG